MLTLVHAALDQSVVSDVVGYNGVGDHAIVHEDGLVDHVSLDASLDHASVDENTRLNSLSLHLVKDSERFFDLAQVLVYLGQNGVSHITWLDLELPHIGVALERHL